MMVPPPAATLMLSALLVSACAVETRSGDDRAPAAAESGDAPGAPSADTLFDAYLEEDRAMEREMREARPLSRTDELAARVERDQRVRRLLVELMETPGAGPDDARLTWLRLIRHMNGLDRENTAWLKTQLEEVFWFTISEYGEAADDNAFLITQHAAHDPDFMRAVHARLETLVEQGETAADNVALLTDRLAVMDGEPQPYGSQFECAGGQQQLQTPLADPAPVVDARRAEAGLPPLAEYRAVLPDCASVPGGG